MSAAPATLTEDELLARFVKARSWVRQDGTLRPDVFMPPPGLNLSTTRHAGLTEADLWRIGEEAILQAGGHLLGRADIGVRAVSSVEGLRAERAPLPENPNHAHIVGWPSEKPAQKDRARRLADLSDYVPRP